MFRNQPILLTLAVLLMWGTSRAAFAAAPADIAASPITMTAPTTKPVKPKYRAIVKGVEITIPVRDDEDDTFGTHDIPEVLTGIPNLSWKPNQFPESQTLKTLATAASFRRPIWQLEFTFKPVRMISMDVPGSEGNQKKQIWYMVYHVKNNGQHLKPVKQDNGTYKMERADMPVTFLPQFVLEAPEYGNKAYLDRLMPGVIATIQAKEDPKRRLYNSVEISQLSIPVSTKDVDRSVYGVATWENVDPRIDFFSVFVQGLTNAYRWTDEPGAFKPDSDPTTGRILTRATLRLSFWRPGDEFVEEKRQIRFGTPDNLRSRQLGFPEVDFDWIYR
jgi:hypothetical protein